MFSGIVEEVGKITAVADDAGGRRMRIAAPLITDDLKLGDSVSCSGACLTACDLGPGWFAAEATPETLRRTKLGHLRSGDELNLERALKVSDRLGGHIVSGHVDAVGLVESIKQDGFSCVIEFSATADLEPFFVEKGSVTIDGVSLTVAYLRPRHSGPGGANVGIGAGINASASSSTGKGSFSFAVALIPHTLSITTLSKLAKGDQVNIEADLIGKYVSRLVSAGYVQNINKGGVSLSFLQEHGYT